MRFAVFIYDGVEPVDLATYGVLSMARRIAPEISMFTVAPRAGEVQMANGLRVIADYGFTDCPPSDALIVTGGPGWVAQSESEETLGFMRRYAAGRVCRGRMHWRHDPGRLRHLEWLQGNHQTRDRRC